jgi:hypothetical protein
MSNSLQITAADAEFARQYNEQAKQATPQASVKVNLGGTTSVAFDGEQSTTSFSQGINRVTESSFKTGGIVGSLGLKQQHDKAVVQTPYGTMELRTAHSVGLVGRDANGHYYDLGDEPQKKVAQNQPKMTALEFGEAIRKQGLNHLKI